MHSVNHRPFGSKAWSVMPDGVSSCCTSLGCSAFTSGISGAITLVLRLLFFSVSVQLVPEFNVSLIPVWPRQGKEATTPIGVVASTHDGFQNIGSRLSLGSRKVVPHP